MKTILGIDPGAFGALAFYNEEELIIYDMPTNRINNRNALDIHALDGLIKANKVDFCWLEKTTPLPKLGGLPCYGMGYSEGAILGILAANIIPYQLVRPNVWKEKLSCPKDKDGARQRASQLLPQFAHNWPLKKHDGRAEAALIAYYGLKTCL